MLPIPIIRLIVGYNIDELFETAVEDCSSPIVLDWFMMLFPDPSRWHSKLINCCKEGQLNLVEHFKNNHWQLFERDRVEGFYEACFEGKKDMIKWFLVNKTITREILNERFCPWYEVVFQRHGLDIIIEIDKRMELNCYVNRETLIQINPTDIAGVIEEQQSSYQSELNAGIMICILVLILAILY